jgi:SEC-C motif-containing protein
MHCPCGSGLNYSDCCALFHNGQVAATPEQLMRSRYSAYVLGNLGEYLFQTWHPDTRGDLTIASLQNNNTDWKKLDVLSHQQNNNRGEVEFKAWYLEQGQLNCLHERSRFEHIGGQWLYLEGDIFASNAASVGRNDPCPCGSGRKFKKCCDR